VDAHASYAKNAGVMCRRSELGALEAASYLPRLAQAPLVEVVVAVRFLARGQSRRLKVVCVVGTRGGRRDGLALRRFRYPGREYLLPPLDALALYRLLHRILLPTHLRQSRWGALRLSRAVVLRRL
jgi:hypothetical protein